MKIKKLSYFVLGFIIILNGIFFIDLASMALKNDLYTLNYLGYLNQFFATTINSSIKQTFFSFLFVFCGFVLIFKGVDY